MSFLRFLQCSEILYNSNLFCLFDFSVISNIISLYLVTLSSLICHTIQWHTVCSVVTIQQCIYDIFFILHIIRNVWVSYLEAVLIIMKEKAEWSYYTKIWLNTPSEVMWVSANVRFCHTLSWHCASWSDYLLEKYWLFSNKSISIWCMSKLWRSSPCQCLMYQVWSVYAHTVLEWNLICLNN